ncbi:MAG: hypothetical protein WDN69_12670 [Aliidongia sp.]
MNVTALRLRSASRSRLVPAGLGLALVLVSSGVWAQAADPANGGSERSGMPAIGLKTTIHVQEATLGAGAVHCDVTELVRQKCDRRDHCEIEVSKSLCPEKRLPGLLYPLKVAYQCRIGEMARTVTADEPNRLRLLCAPNSSPTG